jgi:hypothetical protein
MFSVPISSGIESSAYLIRISHFFVLPKLRRYLSVKEYVKDPKDATIIVL